DNTHIVGEVASFTGVTGIQVVFHANNFGAGPDAGIEAALMAVVQAAGDGATGGQGGATPQVLVGNVERAADFSGGGDGSCSDCNSQCGQFQYGFLAHGYSPLQ